MMRSLILLLFIVQFFSVNVYGQMDPNCNGINDPCKMANDTLAPCDGYLTPVTPEALSGAKPFHYSLNIKDPDKMGLYKCSCTAKFYDYVAGCTTCFQGPGVNVTVDSFETFAGYCLNAGYDVNDPSKQPATPPKTSAKAPPSPTPSPKQNPTTPPPPSSKKSCNTPNDPCIAVNETLTICGGVFSPPFKSTSSGSYGVDDPKLAPCMCNDKFYQQLKNCTMCFATPTNNITVVPLDKFKEECSKLGVTYGATLPNGGSSLMPSIIMLHSLWAVAINVIYITY